MEKNTSNPLPESSVASDKSREAPAALNRTIDASKVLASLSLDIEKITDPIIKQTILTLFNLVEQQASINKALQEEIQRLRNENNRLKGEQGKPEIKPNKKNSDISSEEERRSREPESRKERGTKRDKLKIDRIEFCCVDRKKLPADAQFKGYQSVVVQGLKIEPENIEFKKEIFYSPSQNKTYTGELPVGYEGGYAPELRSTVISLKYVSNMSERKILEFLHEHNVDISAATISRILTQKLETFHQEKTDLCAAALETSLYHQIDDTSARVCGQNHHTHIMCNEFYAAYFTMARKDRLTILDILRQFKSREYLFNEESMRLLEELRVPEHMRRKITQVPQGARLGEAEFDAILKTLFADVEKNALHQTRIKEAAAIAAYHQEIGYPIVKVLICDDAPQFKLLTEAMGLCWVHDGRHYKKLCPIVPYHLQLLEAFREQYWDFYAKLLIFKAGPSDELAVTLSTEFERLFATKTGYEDLDARIAKTRAKKNELLLVLRHPALPLHNNACELEARVAARRRDVSLHAMTKEGVRACDTMTSIVRTARKLGISAFQYIYDRVSRSFRFMSLAEQIRARAVNPTKPCAETH